MVERDAPGLGQDQPTPAALEQGVTEAVLQRLDLGRQGRLRQVQTPRGAGQRAVGGHGAKEAQVMQVQPIHHSIITNEWR